MDRTELTNSQSYRRVTDLKPSEYNPRRMTEKEHADLKTSIERFGIVDPLIINNHATRQNVIIGGHQRYYLAKELGIEKVPVFIVNLNEERERELNLRLNKNLGSWDFDMLANNFEMDLLTDVGFTTNDLELNLDKFEESEKESEEKETKGMICPACGYEFKKNH